MRLAKLVLQQQFSTNPTAEDTPNIYRCFGHLTLMQLSLELVSSYVLFENLTPVQKALVFEDI